MFVVVLRSFAAGLVLGGVVALNLPLIVVFMVGALSMFVLPEPSPTLALLREVWPKLSGWERTSVYLITGTVVMACGIMVFV